MDLRENSVFTSRRLLLSQAGCGFGSLAVASLFSGGQAYSDQTPIHERLHHRPKVRRVIQLFMNGGASPMDTFDYKPALAKYDGEMLGPKQKPEGFTAPAGAVMKSPFEFAQYGESGRWVSTVFPHQAKIVDELAFLMAMTTKTNVHGPASYMMNTGFMLPGFPCFGAWLSYALGSVRDELPAFVVLPDPRGLPYNQQGNFSAGFLPSRHQGTLIRSVNEQPIPHLQPPSEFGFATGKADQATWEFINELNRQHVQQNLSESQLETEIRSAELAAKMQLSAPEAFDLGSETEITHRSYGIDNPTTTDFGSRCLLARRLIERGTRFVQVWSGPQGAVNNWDNHGNIQNELPSIAASVDQPIAALITDLKDRGLFEDTLVIWTTEFGRTPFAQGSLGRDHNRGTFVTWLAGAGIKPGSTYGESDELGYLTASGETYCYDLHATVLHLMGIDHESLTYRTSGIDRRLTDVHGHVIREVLA